MAKKLKDTDYLAISARIKAMETHLLSKEQMEQLLEARSSGDVEKLLQECGYPNLDPSNPEKLDTALSEIRRETLEDVATGMPDIRYLDVFKLKYDYHNIKASLKAQAMQTNPDAMLMDMGRISAQEIRDAVLAGEDDKLPGMLAEALKEAREVLETTRDPQLSDMVLDRWYYRDLTAVADQIGSPFLSGYVRIQIDAANLRVLVRTLRMGKGEGFLENALFEGGNVSSSLLLHVSKGGGLTDAFRSTALQFAAEAGEAALKGGQLTEFEKLCDDAVDDYLADAKFIPFGEAPLLSYLAARETEYINLRIILTGRQAGIAPEIIRSRLRISAL